MNNQTPRQEHQILTSALIRHFTKVLGYSILEASLPGFQSPSDHGGYRPDIVARDQNGVLHIAEAELGDQIYTQQTREQFLAFSNRVMSDSRIPVPFHIVVYRYDVPVLRKCLVELGLGHLIGNRIRIWTL